MSRYTLVVNAGGASRRMQGRIKALLPVPPDETPLITHIIGRLRPLATAGVVVVSNDTTIADAVRAAGLDDGAARPDSEHADSAQPEIMVVADAWEDAGPMGGIATGLAHCAEWAIVVACDMPFVDPDLIGFLCDLADERDSRGRRLWDAVVPRIHGYPQMLHALYHVDVLAHFQRLIQVGDLKLLNVLPAVKVRFVAEAELTVFDPDLMSFTNVNTPPDWALAHQRLKMEG